MLPLLTKYLVQYKRVSIPHVGTFEIIQQSPELQVADKLLSAPVFTTRYVSRDFVPEHQFRFIACSEASEKEKLERELSLFGENLKKRIIQAPFCWNGFGTLRYSSSELTFEPQVLELQSLQFLPAKKLIRENAQHSVLVGDQQMTSQEVSDVLSKIGFRKSSVILLGWIVFTLALIAIGIILYLGKFEPTAAGLRNFGF